jgi:hypothetical protein
MIIPIDRGQISDGYHTFDELYRHRAHLFVALMKSHPDISWWSNHHADGSMFPGAIIAGLDLPNGVVTYHLEQHYGAICERAGIKQVNEAPEWDGHTSEDVIVRLHDWIERKA